jgi:V-type H+-transporting ATPase subunit a
LLAPFQVLVNICGSPRYKEMNPAVFLIISFPFFYGLMFGDVGHGFFVLMFGIWLQIQSRNEIKNSMVEFRWLVTICGFFAVFCGLIYNDFFHLPLLLQNSCFENETLVYKDKCTYYFGIDWTWSMASNFDSFINSFKMKFAIIIGVFQMLFGVVLKICNNIEYKDYIDIVFESIPQFCFIFSLFGYMVFCIVFKWLKNWKGGDAPSIIQTFVNFISVGDSLIGNAKI